MEWNGMEWNGMEWNGMVWYGMVWYGLIECAVHIHGQVVNLAQQLALLQCGVWKTESLPQNTPRAPAARPTTHACAACEGCLMVGCDHGPQAEVAQGVGPGPLVER